MIKRPLDPQFSAAVREGRKVTTIRETPWPVGKPVMLYNWSGKPYRSKHADVAAVKVRGWWTIRITRHDDDSMSYECGRKNTTQLFESEGFECQAEMDEWFRAVVKRGETVEKVLMGFALLKEGAAK